MFKTHVTNSEKLSGMAAGEDIMAFIGFVGFVVILFSAVKIIVAGKPTAEGEEKGAVISAVCPPLSKG